MKQQWQSAHNNQYGRSCLPTNLHMMGVKELNVDKLQEVAETSYAKQHAL